MDDETTEDKRKEDEEERKGATIRGAETALERRKNNNNSLLSAENGDCDEEEEKEEIDSVVIEKRSSCSNLPRLRGCNQCNDCAGFISRDWQRKSCVICPCPRAAHASRFPNSELSSGLALNGAQRRAILTSGQKMVLKAYAWSPPVNIFFFYIGLLF